MKAKQAHERKVFTLSFTKDLKPKNLGLKKKVHETLELS
jgi:hypothetical protein